MAITVKVLQVGNSLGIVLPKEVLAELNVERGDMVHLVRHSEGFLITPYNPDFATRLDALETVMRENRDVLRKLAE